MGKVKYYILSIIMILSLSNGISMPLFSVDHNLYVAKAEVICNNNWVFDENISPTIEVKLTSDGKSEGVIEVNVKKDTKEQYLNIERLYSFDNGEQTINIGLHLDPGFYFVEISHNGHFVKSFNIGYEPTKIISSTDSKADFNDFWDKAKDELSKVDPKYKIVKDKERSTQHRELYVVSMKSLEGALVQGYLAVPTDKSKTYPVIISYMGYGANAIAPNTSKAINKIDFIVSVRGQGLNKPKNNYGDWIVNNLSSKDKYYYRGAFMDLIRVVDFIEQLPQADTRNIFANGTSQGGAFALIAASLDNRFAAVASAVPFLSDYADYFKIVGWPANVILAEQKRLGISDEQLYTTLSYFDVKNFTHMISCPVIMYSGLQDPVCPPHTNFSGYNHITTHKEYYIEPKGTHSVDYQKWNTMRDNFFERHTTNDN